MDAFMLGSSLGQDINCTGEVMLQRRSWVRAVTCALQGLRSTKAGNDRCPVTIRQF